jgi:hypothetical protein
MPTVTDRLWDRIQSLLPVRPRRFRYPGRKPLDDRQQARRVGQLDWSRALVDSSQGRSIGGDKTGPSPVDRGRLGRTHHLITDAAMSTQWNQL